MAVHLRMTLVEPRARGHKRFWAQPFGKQSVERRAQLVTLARVAQVELAHEARLRAIHALSVELLARIPFQLSEDALSVIGGELGQWPQLRTDIIVHHVGAKQAERREGAGS